MHYIITLINKINYEIENYKKSMEQKLLTISSQSRKIPIYNENIEPQSFDNSLLKADTNLKGSEELQGSELLTTIPFTDANKTYIFNTLSPDDQIKAMNIENIDERWNFVLSENKKMVVDTLGYYPSDTNSPSFPSYSSMQSPSNQTSSAQLTQDKSISQIPDYYKQNVLDDGTIIVGPKYDFPDGLGYYYMKLPKEEKNALENKTFEEQITYLQKVKNEDNNLTKTGGSINLFPNNPNKNAAFNMLGGEGQSQILQMEPEQRDIVMDQIILKSSKQLGGKPINSHSQETATSSSSPLTQYFTNLPIKTQLGALQGGYKSMSTEFNKLAGAVDMPFIKINKPDSMHNELSKQLPLLSVNEEKNTNIDILSDSNSSNNNLSNNNSSNNNLSNNNSSNNNSSNNNSTNNNSSNNIKTISF